MPEPRVLHVVAGLPGFPAARRFELVDAADVAPGLSTLRSLDVAGLEFVVAAAARWFPGYVPELDAESRQRLGLRYPRDALMLVILTLGPGPATANLRAPIVVNPRTYDAAQVVPIGEPHALRAPLLAP